MRSSLRSLPLSEQTRRTYASKVRQFLAWLAGADLAADPLTSADGRDYRTHLQAVLRRSPATVNNALAAINDFYIRRGLGPRQCRPRGDHGRGAPRARPTRPAALPARSPTLPLTARCCSDGAIQV
jgi:integrase/recombinase XerC